VSEPDEPHIKHTSARRMTNRLVPKAYMKHAWGEESEKRNEEGSRSRKSRLSPVNNPCTSSGLVNGQRRVDRIAHQSVYPRWRRRRCRWRRLSGGSPCFPSLLPCVTATLRSDHTVVGPAVAGPLVASDPRQSAPGASRALRRIYQGALRAMPLQHRRDRAHSPRVVMAPPLRRAISPLVVYRADTSQVLASAARHHGRAEAYETMSPNSDRRL